uniref:Apple domain-containing protein n=1 Tax=Nothobranchius kuhntae TaxID=321403 RepID=A0A1A8HP15_NOTKU
MVPLLVVVLLLSFSSYSLSDDCNTEFLFNVNFPGSDLTFLYSPSVDHCQQLCTQHPECLFFTFIRPDWTTDDRHFHCFLKSTTSGQPTSQTQLLGVTSGFSLKPCSPDPLPCFSQDFEDVNFFGADYRTLFTADYNECQRACTQDPGCQFFTFVNKDFSQANIRFKCHLKFSWPVPAPPNVERKTGLISGFSQNIQFPQQIAPACEGKLFQSTNIPGSDLLSLQAASSEHCQVLCSAHPQCSYFSFVRNDFTCFLKDNLNGLTFEEKEGVTSGFPARFCQLSNDWIKQTHEGVDFRGSDIRNEQLDNAGACQAKCTEDLSCQFYTYLTDNFSDAAFRRRCFLKRVITMPAPAKVNKMDNVVSGFSLRNCVNAVQ